MTCLFKVFITSVDDLDYPKKLLGVSYVLLGTVGFLSSTVIGILVSVATGKLAAFTS